MASGLDSARRSLEAGVAALDLKEPVRVVPALLRYVGLLVHWNRRFNLTGTRAPVDIVQRHVLDCLSVAPHVDQATVLDAGTGAGLPGLVLAVACPQLHFTLLDSAGKKTRFCMQAVAELGLTNVEVVQARLEEFAPAGRYSGVVSRAFVSTPELVKKSRQLLSPGGTVLAMKGAYPKEDLETLAADGLTADVVALSVPGLREARHLMIVRTDRS